MADPEIERTPRFKIESVVIAIVAAACLALLIVTVAYAVTPTG